MAADTERARGFFADPERYVTNNPYIGLRAKIVRQMLLTRERKSIIDLGCGDGGISIPLIDDGGELLLVDGSQQMLDLALRNADSRHSSRITGLCVDVSNFVPTSTYDVVLCLGVLAHIGDYVRALQLIARCVAPNGCAIIQVSDEDYFLARIAPRMAYLYSKIRKTLYAVNRMTLRGVQAELQRSGLALAAVERYVAVPGLRLLPPVFARAIANAAASPALAAVGGDALALFVPQ